MYKNRKFKEYGFAENLHTQSAASGWVRSTCPLCSNGRKSKAHRAQKCVAINLESGGWTCHNCGATGYIPPADGEAPDFPVVAGELRKKSEPRQYNVPRWEPEFLIEQVQLNPSRQQQATLDYLTQTRCLSLEALTRLRLTLPYNRNCTESVIAFNYFVDGKLANQKTRTLDKRFEHPTAGCRVVPYNIDAIRKSPTCYITEGEFDVCALASCGIFEAISVPTGGNATNLDWLDPFVETHFDNKQTIYLCLDLDTVGMKMMRELVRRLEAGRRIRIVVWDDGCKDANDELMRHGSEGVMRCIRQAAMVPVDGVMSALDPLVERSLDDLFNDGLQAGANIGLPNVDKLITFETGRFMVVTGRPGDGKSELVDEICLRLATRYGWKMAYYSPENHPLSLHLAKLISKLTGYPFKNEGRMTPALFETCKRWLDENVCSITPSQPPRGEEREKQEHGLSNFQRVRLHFSEQTKREESYTLTDILDMMSQAVHRRGVRQIVLDPLNAIERNPEDAGLTDYAWYRKVCNTLLAFAHLYDVLVILVAHPRKVDRSVFDGKRRRVEMNDISGSADFGNKCDFCICVDRNDEIGVVTLYVDKVKFKNLGKRGECYLHYDALSGRYVPCTVRRIPSPNPDEKPTYEKTIDWVNFNRRWIE